MTIDYDGKKFRSVSNSASGEVGAETVFHYRQDGSIVSAEYSGGRIVRGSLIATCSDDGRLEMAYSHINMSGELMAGICTSSPEILPDGRIRLHEKWRWTHGGEGRGESIVEEI